MAGPIQQSCKGLAGATSPFPSSVRAYLTANVLLASRTAAQAGKCWLFHFFFLTPYFPFVNLLSCIAYRAPSLSQDMQLTLRAETSSCMAGPLGWPLGWAIPDGNKSCADMGCGADIPWMYRNQPRTLTWQEEELYSKPAVNLGGSRELLSRGMVYSPWACYCGACCCWLRRGAPSPSIQSFLHPESGRAALRFMTRGHTLAAQGYSCGSHHAPPHPTRPDHFPNWTRGWLVCMCDNGILTTLHKCILRAEHAWRRKVDQSGLHPPFALPTGSPASHPSEGDSSI